jgi:hypothetical protein
LQVPSSMSVSVQLQGRGSSAVVWAFGIVAFMGRRYKVIWLRDIAKGINSKYCM